MNSIQTVERPNLNYTLIKFEGKDYKYFFHFPIKNTTKYMGILATDKKSPDEIRHYFLAKRSDLENIVLSVYTGNTVDLTGKAKLFNAKNFLKQCKQVMSNKKSLKQRIFGSFMVREGELNNV